MRVKCSWNIWELNSDVHISGHNNAGRCLFIIFVWFVSPSGGFFLQFVLGRYVLFYLNFVEKRNAIWFLADGLFCSGLFFLVCCDSALLLICINDTFYKPSPSQFLKRESEPLHWPNVYAIIYCSFTRLWLWGARSWTMFLCLKMTNLLNAIKRRHWKIF